MQKEIELYKNKIIHKITYTTINKLETKEEIYMWLKLNNLLSENKVESG